MFDAEVPSLPALDDEEVQKIPKQTRHTLNFEKTQKKNENENENIETTFEEFDEKNFNEEVECGQRNKQISSTRKLTCMNQKRSLKKVFPFHHSSSFSRPFKSSLFKRTLVSPKNWKSPMNSKFSLSNFSELLEKMDDTAHSNHLLKTYLQKFLPLLSHSTQCQNQTVTQENLSELMENHIHGLSSFLQKFQDSSSEIRNQLQKSEDFKQSQKVENLERQISSLEFQLTQSKRTISLLSTRLENVEKNLFE